MKRYRLSVSPGLATHVEEHPAGEWVNYDDANAWWQEMKELPRVQDVATIYEMRKLLERALDAINQDAETVLSADIRAALGES